MFPGLSCLACCQTAAFLESRRYVLHRRISRHRFVGAILAGLIVFMHWIHCAEAALVNLDFTNAIEAASGTSIFGDPLITSSTIRFEEVAPGIDMRLTISSLGTGHSYLGLTSNYTPGSGAEPNDDLGVFYQGDVSGTTGGVRLAFSFFQSDNLVNSLALLATPIVLDAANIMLYDVDGEASQAERALAYYGDGLRAYQVRQNAPRLNVTNDGMGTYTINGPGTNRNENDIRAAAILHYDDTSGFTIDLLATTTGTVPNIVFTGFDGDLSYIPSMVNGPFGPLQDASAPEPFGLMFGGLAFVACVSRLRKKHPQEIPNKD